MLPTHSNKVTHTHTHKHTNTLKQRHLRLSPNTPGNVFLLWGGLSGVVHWSQPSVINCHNASKLTNGLCVKESPLIYWPPLIDPEPIISITAGFHVWASSPANPRFFCLTLRRFSGTCRSASRTQWLFDECVQTWDQTHKGTCTVRTHTNCVLLDTGTRSLHPLSFPHE